MILNYKERGPVEKWFEGGKVLVDGKEIRRVWYIDTELGIVKTYDVRGDGESHSSWDCQDLKGQPGIELPLGGVASKTIKGRVQVFDGNGDPWTPK